MEGNGHFESAEQEKSLFRIGEVSRLTSTKPFVLRYWETEFPTLQPEKSPKGHRLYRREDIETVFVIKRLLYDEGFTIAGARRHLRDQAGDILGDASATPGTGTGTYASDAETSPASGGHTDAPAYEQRPHTGAYPADEPSFSGRSRLDDDSEGVRREFSQRSAPAPARLAGSRSARSSSSLATVDRQILLELRDSLRSLLTLLESE